MRGFHENSLIGSTVISVPVLRVRRKRMNAANGGRRPGIFSAHNYRGVGYPWGNEHKVIRKNRDCECCYPENCCTGIADGFKKIFVPEVVCESEEILAGGRKK